MALNSAWTSAVVATADGTDRAVRRIVTPEGVTITVRLAGRGERAAALIIDLMVIAGVALALGLVFVLAISAGGASGDGWLAAIGLVVWFALRSFYFIALELRWQGKTVGKRLLGLRVIDRAGGRLGADAVFARNLMREVEVFIPISLVFAGGADGVELWVRLCSIVWAAVFVALPLFNGDRLRAGDIVAGTWVVAAPKAALLPDMASAAVDHAERPATGAPALYVFTVAQLDAYGIFELQTLETVLRHDGADVGETREVVCERIRRKIGWPETDAPTGTPVDADLFLETFYAALRARLEGRMLLGVRREDKHDPS
jgi:uncharacterized RDD family membrane protein YckC